MPKFIWIFVDNGKGDCLIFTKQKTRCRRIFISVIINLSAGVYSLQTSIMSVDCGVSR